MADQAKKLQVDVIARIDKLEKAMAKAAGVTDHQMGKVENRAKQMTGRLDAQFAKIGSGLKGGAIAAFAGVGAGALAALAPIALFNTALATINDASRLVDVADRIGITTTALQELSFGFSQAGVEAATFETGMEQFSKRIGEAATSGGKLADILEANGVAIRDSNGQIKSSETLLRSYADLVRNAASEQEKMLLVTEAFGRGGGDMINALNEGAAGIDKMKKAAADAGGVIDEELLRRAEEMGDRWDAAWRRFTVSSQSAILSALNGLDKVRDRFREFEERKAAAALGAMAGSMVGTQDDGKRGRLNTPDDRVARAFEGEISAADAKLVDALKARYGNAAAKATIIPGGDDSKSKSGGGRNAEAAAALREAEAVLRVIESLREERALIGATDAERAKSNALRQAGKAATAEQRTEIESLIEAIYREEEATQAAADAAQELRDVGQHVLGGFIDDMLAGKDAADALADSLRNIGSRLINSGLDSLFGGGSGGAALDFLFKGFEGFSSGGYTGPGDKNVPAGVVHRGEYVFDKAAVDRIGVGQLEAMRKGGVAMPDMVRAPVMPKIAAAGGGGNITVDARTTIHAPNADAAGLARLEGMIRKRDLELPSRVIATVRDAQKRRVKLH